MNDLEARGRLYANIYRFKKDFSVIEHDSKESVDELRSRRVKSLRFHALEGSINFALEIKLINSDELAKMIKDALEV